jgi:hypothetical protein
MTVGIGSIIFLSVVPVYAFILLIFTAYTGKQINNIIEKINIRIFKNTNGVNFKNITNLLENKFMISYAFSKIKESFSDDKQAFLTYVNDYSTTLNGKNPNKLYDFAVNLLKTEYKGKIRETYSQIRKPKTIKHTTAMTQSTVNRRFHTGGYSKFVLKHKKTNYKKSINKQSKYKQSKYKKSKINFSKRNRK